MSRDCAACGERAEPGDRFCEQCGAALPTPEVIEPDAAPPTGSDDGAPGMPRRTDLRADIEAPAACPACGSVTDATHGYCDACGRPRPDPRDHVEAQVSGAVALTDRGLVRARNEDAYGAVTLPGGVTAAVVCDGVASVPGGEEASLVACEAAVDAAVLGPDPGATTPTDIARRSAEVAREAVAGLAEGRRDPPACTYVGAVVTGEEIAVAWVGDSRAYWIADQEPDTEDGDDSTRLLTVDDSWAAEVIALGLFTPEAAWSDRRAHVITRWLAADAPDLPVRTTVLRPEGPGALLLCSDGLWNHLPDPETLAALHRGASGTKDLAESARAMLGAALDDGGHDNTTLVLIAAGTRLPREDT